MAPTRVIIAVPCSFGERSGRRQVHNYVRGRWRSSRARAYVDELARAEAAVHVGPAVLLTLGLQIALLTRQFGL